MLQLTPTAAREMERLRPTNLPEHVIARIARDERCAHLRARLTFVTAPRTGDHAGESNGLPLCVGEDLAVQLDEMVLDVRSDGSAFFVRPVNERRDQHAVGSHRR